MFPNIDKRSASHLFPPKQSRQREPIVKTLRSPRAAPFSRLSETQLLTMFCYHSEKKETKSFPRVEIEPTNDAFTVRNYSTARQNKNREPSTNIAKFYKLDTCPGFGWDLHLI